MEALGGHAETLLVARAESWPWVARINPRQDRHSAWAIGQLSKTGNRIRITTGTARYAVWFEPDGLIPLHSPSMPAETLRLLLIDDDALLRDRVLTPRLRQFGFEVMAIGHVGEMAQAIERRKPDIVLLDIGLPDHDGFEISRNLRAQFSDIGIVMLTGRSETTDRVRGLSEGADAYLSKPVEIDVLVATLHSVARRLKLLSTPAILAGTWKLDSDDWLLLSPSGGRVILSKTERLLLEELMRHPNQVVVRDALIGAITDDVHAFDPHRLDSLIHRLRRKVLTVTGEPLPLNAVHGQGYLLAVS